MDEKLIVAIIAALGALFGVVEAYIKRKKADSSGGDDLRMRKKDKVMFGKSKVNRSVVGNMDSHNTTIMGDVLIQQEFQKENEMKKREGEQMGSSSDVGTENIILKDEYTSIFVENGAIHSERITIKNVGNGKIEGSVYLNDSYDYTLSGTFRNRILTGEFVSTGKYTDERGTINLKLISEDILSGFCSFSKISMSWEDQIRVSPYVWVAGKNTDLTTGTYEFCTQCHNAGKKCCCASEEVDMPVILKSEAQKYQALNPRNQRMKDFSHTLPDSNAVRQINETKGSQRHCHFYDLAENKCKIYDIRPTDCRLFPFDIKYNVNTKEYWVGYYDEICDRTLPDKETMKKYAHILRPQLFLLFPYAEVINCNEACEQLSKTHFEELYRLHDFIF